MLKFYLPILLSVLGTTLYHVAQKSIPAHVNPILSLVVNYGTALAISFVISQPAAVVFDLRGLVYTWGDAIGSIVYPLQPRSWWLFALVHCGSRSNSASSQRVGSPADDLRCCWDGLGPDCP